MGDIVELTTNQTGIVVDINRDRPERPVVRLFQTDVAESQYSPELDLAKHEEIGVRRLIAVRRIDVGRQG